ncbi:MAG: two pore domain potassium channel family protein [Acetobacteraceae bacterium]|nr:two pore domain potassium channel family protein [Acetobacteraceae bacterium]
MEERIAPTRAERTLRSAELRRRFLVALYRELRIVWPIMSGLIGVQLGLGALVAHFEQWPFGQAAYFAFVTGLTIGYGDLVPSRLITRLAAIVIGFIGILLTGLVAAVGVHALQEARSNDPE